MYVCHMDMYNIVKHVLSNNALKPLEGTKQSFVKIERFNRYFQKTIDI